MIDHDRLAKELLTTQSFSIFFYLLATLRLDPARMRLISGFIDTYLRLNQQETLLFEQQVATLLGKTEKAKLMELTTSWKEEGLEIGRREGRQEGRQRECQLLIRILRKHLGALDSNSELRMQQLSFDDLDALGEASVDFKSVADLQSWLAKH